VEVVTLVSYKHPKLQIAYKQTLCILLSAQTCILSILLTAKKIEKKGGFTFSGDDEPGWREGVEQGFRPQVAVIGRGLSEDATRKTSSAGRDHRAFLRP
jgi:hypothetical protein